MRNDELGALASQDELGERRGAHGARRVQVDRKLLVRVLRRLGRAPSRRRRSGGDSPGGAEARALVRRRRPGKDVARAVEGPARRSRRRIGRIRARGEGRGRVRRRRVGREAVGAGVGGNAARRRVEGLRADPLRGGRRVECGRGREGVVEGGMRWRRGEGGRRLRRRGVLLRLNIDLERRARLVGRVHRRLRLRLLDPFAGRAVGDERRRRRARMPPVAPIGPVRLRRTRIGLQRLRVVVARRVELRRTGEDERAVLLRRRRHVALRGGLAPGRGRVADERYGRVCRRRGEMALNGEGWRRGRVGGGRRRREVGEGGRRRERALGGRVRAVRLGVVRRGDVRRLGLIRRPMAGRRRRVRAAAGVEVLLLPGERRERDLELVGRVALRLLGLMPMVELLVLLREPPERSSAPWDSLRGVEPVERLTSWDDDQGCESCCICGRGPRWVSVRERTPACALPLSCWTPTSRRSRTHPSRSSLGVGTPHGSQGGRPAALCMSLLHLQVARPARRRVVHARGGVGPASSCLAAGGGADEGGRGGEQRGAQAA